MIMPNKIFKSPNGVTLDLSKIEEEPSNLIVKGVHLDKISDRLEKDIDSIIEKAEHSLPKLAAKAIKRESENISRIFKTK